MLKGIPNCISPDLMAAMMRMGHGDGLLLADADFPADRYGRQVIRADGVKMQTLLQALLEFYPLDGGEDSVTVMAPWQGAQEAPVLREMKPVFSRYSEDFKDYHYAERFAFYEYAKGASVLVVTGEADGNFILRKGIVNS